MLTHLFPNHPQSPLGQNLLEPSQSLEIRCAINPVQAEGAPGGRFAWWPWARHELSLNLSFCLCGLGSSPLKVEGEIFKGQCGLMSRLPLPLWNLKLIWWNKTSPWTSRGQGNHRWGNRGTEKLRNLPKLSQLISGKTGREPVRLAPESVLWETRWTMKAAGRQGVMERPGAE